MTKTPKPLDQWQLEDAARLRAIFAKQDKTQGDFGYEFGIGTPGMVWQYLAGRRPLNIAAAEAFARGLGIGIVEFSPTIAEKIMNAAKVTGLRSQDDGQAAGFGPQWISPDAFRLVNLYYGAADDEARERIMRSAENAPRGVPATISNKTQP